MSPRPATLVDYDWLYKNAIYGENPLEHAHEAIPLILEMNPESVVDIGGGRGELMKALAPLGICAGSLDPVDGDGATGPRLPNIHVCDRYADIITCFDVLEHLPPDQVFASIQELGRLACRAVFATIYTGSDVRQINGEMVEMHLTQMHENWWHAIFEKALPDWSIRRIACKSPLRWLFVATSGTKGDQ